MYKKIILIFIMIMGFLSFKSEVFAISASAKEGEANFETFKSEFNKGIVTKTISSPSTEVTIYGKSDCVSGGNCTYQYQGVNGGDSVNKVLEQMIRCANGETSINIQDGGSGGLAYKDTNAGNYNGTVYWTETYYVTCLSTGGTTTVDNNDTNSSTDTSNNTSTDTQDEDTSYSSSSTEESPKTGVSTYYIILGITALVAYLAVLIVKKFNLFQKI